MHSKLRNLALAALSSTAAAVTCVSDAQMTAWLHGDLIGLANAYAPLYFFGQAQNQPPCIPTWAFSGSPSTPDVYDSAHQTKPAKQCGYPNVGCDCRNPGVPIGNPAPAFPVYFSVKQCSDTEVRVAYNLFYQKDGAKVLFVNTGHDYDWERNIIVHNKNANGTWEPTKLLASAHSGYNKYDWGDIQNTLSTEQIMDGAAKDPNGVRNQDHPKVYVAWSKHPFFDDRNTGWNDPVSQSDGNAFRSQDWWYYVDPKYYIQADSSTPAGKALAAANWGEASSNPPSVADGICSQGN